MRVHLIQLVLAAATTWFAASTDLVSPCPSVFAYRHLDAKNHVWYGTLLLSARRDAYQVASLRILLDSPATQLRLYQHKHAVRIESFDYKEFLLVEPGVTVRPGTTVPLTFLVQFPAAGPVPQLTAFRVNDVTVCSLTYSLGLDGLPVKRPVLAESTTAPTSSTTSRYQGSSNELVLGAIDHGPVHHVDGCGTRIQSAAPLIVNGEPSIRGQWPWHGALYVGDVKGLSYRCGMSLVTAQHVITAAHCVTVRQHSEQPLDPDALLLFFGKTLLNRWHAPETQEAQVSWISVHPAYNSSNLHNDIAVLKLARPVRVTSYVRPICLWQEAAESIESLLNRPGTIVGWGLTRSGDISNRLQHAELPVVDSLACVFSNPTFYAQYSSPKSFCAGVPGKTSACNGDSGGGLVFPRPGTDVWQLRGVVSLSAVDSKTGHCDVQQFAVFTDVALYLKWLQAQIRS